DFAFIFLQPKPGTDVIWINGIVKIIIDEGLRDKNFIEAHTENFEEFKSSLGKFSPEYVEKETGIPKEKLREAALLYARTKKAMLFYAMGITQHTCGTDNVKALSNLVMLTGHIGFPSTGLMPIRGQNNVQGACDMGALPNVFPGYQKISDETVRIKFEHSWKVQLPQSPGLCETEMFSSENLRAMYIMGENPALCEPNLNNVKNFLALGRLELVVVQDIFLTETAKYADVILPATSFAEKDGTFTNCDRRIQRVRKAVQPPGQALADWEILCELSRIMGYKMKYKSPVQIMDEIASLTPIYGGIDYSRLESIEGLQWPCPDKKHPGTQYLHKGGNFSRGKGRFFSVEYKPPKELPDAEFPFTLTTGRLYEHWHTSEMTGRIALLQREQPKPYVEINPTDAEELGIKNLQEVKVISRRGYITLQALIINRIPRKVVFIPFHYARAPANMLTIDALDPESKIPEFKVATVRIEK
ncbi:MAG: molybdopterin-dependent oxidoreductase, partial [Elusimicrobiota bacterium]